MDRIPAAGFEWSDTFLLGHGTIDANHREFVELVNAILTASDDDLDARLEAFRAHAERHFGDEDHLMVNEGMPNRQCHLDEHKAVLKSLGEVQALEAGDRKRYIIRDLATELVRWFPGHADEMDAGLAKFLVRKKLGGAPVVLRRKA